MLVCPVCGCSVIRVIKTMTVVELDREYDVDLLECTRCGHQEKEFGE